MMRVAESMGRCFAPSFLPSFLPFNLNKLTLVLAVLLFAAPGFSQTYGVNLLKNPGAEAGKLNWTGSFCTDTAVNSVFPVSGLIFFKITSTNRVYQDVDLTLFSGDIDKGIVDVDYGGMFRNLSDLATHDLTLQFLNYNGTQIDIDSITELYSFGDWSEDFSSWNVTPQTRKIRFIIDKFGSPDLYIDDF